jgi:hypothetical protein
MKRLKIFSVFCVISAFLMSGFFAQPASAIPGDFNGDGNVNLTDTILLVNYLFKGGAGPANPIDVDVDGSPGINLGDVLQLVGNIMGICNLLPYTGVSIEVGSQIRFSTTVIPADTTPGTPITIPIKIIENVQPDLMGMVVPIQYPNEPDEVEVSLDSITFTDMIPLSWAKGVSIDNPNKRVVFYAYDETGGAPIPAGTIGTVANLHFTRLSLGLPLCMSTTQVPPSHSFMLISAYCADGTSPSERIFTPKMSLVKPGDANGDGQVNMADMVYTGMWLWMGGPPPVGL